MVRRRTATAATSAAKSSAPVSLFKFFKLLGRENALESLAQFLFLQAHVFANAPAHCVNFAPVVLKCPLDGFFLLVREREIAAQAFDHALGVWAPARGGCAQKPAFGNDATHQAERENAQQQNNGFRAL